MSINEVRYLPECGSTNAYVNGQNSAVRRLRLRFSLLRKAFFFVTTSIKLSISCFLMLK